ncbi:helix-turn-helix domain containing protein [Mycolicibacterium mucogenicum]|uniref:TetR/AcrR family transcriptional regulator n=1 Tax=Mycolicibacterium mucogenicum TaxID=56689 RepID=UPI00226A5A12|nr:TetR/AcrR family transcriptional regulator [Mycolicibacterium mucogenicum]MCX8555053.1 helix-turn-helix domain containing protein [Mycolicibacterium mucogenicum]
MPKVSDDHRKAQAERFIDAARRCFTRTGVEGTSMEHIRIEAGVSAGLMYRYYASKDEMIRAAISGSMTEFEAIAAAAADDAAAGTALGYLHVILGKLSEFRCHTEGVDLFSLAVQGWAHAQSRPEAKAIIVESFGHQLATYQKAALRWTTKARADDAARAIGAAVVGYIVQSTFSPDDIDVKKYCAGLAALD